MFHAPPVGEEKLSVRFVAMFVYSGSLSVGGIIACANDHSACLPRMVVLWQVREGRGSTPTRTVEAQKGDHREPARVPRGPFFFHHDPVFGVDSASASETRTLKNATGEHWSGENFNLPYLDASSRYDSGLCHRGIPGDGSYADIQAPLPSLSVLIDANFGLKKPDTTLFPGLNSSIQVHGGFADEHAKTAALVLAAVKFSSFSTVKKAVLSVFWTRSTVPLHLTGVTVKSALYGLPRAPGLIFEHDQAKKPYFMVTLNSVSTLQVNC
ncbi:hypothetical protein B0H17DRAFT_1124647 [Mycena rosella]|uniref:Uncharacterized protein n=1 Tax=Mycena rosella TaxID=1033263 RepID=A0AAD7GZW1_MYCRO|nr:hypothetical protein B0H17DRAFT_1124647 [Mycena rosella]